MCGNLFAIQNMYVDVWNCMWYSKYFETFSILIKPLDFIQEEVWSLLTNPDSIFFGFCLFISFSKFNYALFCVSELLI